MKHSLYLNGYYNDLSQGKLFCLFIYTNLRQPRHSQNFTLFIVHG